MFALKAFVKTDKINYVHLRVDNTTTVAQINTMGGTRSQKLFMITRELWQYCISKQIIVTAEHLPGVLNEIADRESRVFHDSSAWKLLSTILVQIERVLGTTDVDLFADRLTPQKSRYISWIPDLGAMVIDAFSVKWNAMNAYVFPPFCLIGRCLPKVRKDQADLLIMTPVWPAQPWYPTLLGMLIELPILLPPIPNILTSPQGELHPLVIMNNLPLAAWKISGEIWYQNDFQESPPNYCQKQDDRERNWLTQGPGKSGVAGVVNEKWIHFRPLWSR